jgi:hypothetical protein
VNGEQPTSGFPGALVRARIRAGGERLAAAGSDRPMIAQRNLDSVRNGLARLDGEEQLSHDQEQLVRTTVDRAACAVLRYSDEPQQRLEAHAALARLTGDRVRRDTVAVAEELRAHGAHIPDTAIDAVTTSRTTVRVAALGDVLAKRGETR